MIILFLPRERLRPRAPFRQYNHEKLSVCAWEKVFPKNRRHVSDSNGHVYENTTCGIDFDGLQILLNTQFQCFSVLILIDEKNAVTYNIEMGVESICFQKPIFLFMFHLSEFSKQKLSRDPGQKRRARGRRRVASHDADDAPERDDDATDPVSTRNTRRPVTSRIDLARAYARRFINRTKSKEKETRC